MASAAQDEQIPAIIAGKGTGGIIDRVNNVMAETPFIDLPLVRNRGITSDNIGRQVQNEADLKNLWLAYIAQIQDLYGPANAKAANEEVWPRLLRMWEAQHAEAAVNELVSKLDQAMRMAQNKVAQEEAAGGSYGGTSPTANAANPAGETAYDLIDTHPDAGGGGWTTVRAGDIEEVLGPDTASFTWGPQPPQRIGASGFAMQMAVKVTAGTGSRLDAIVGASVGGGMTSQPGDPKVEALAESGQKRQGAVNAQFFPPQGVAPGTKVSVKVGAAYGPAVTYTFQAR
jgi:hypothetical protein